MKFTSFSQIKRTIVNISRWKLIICFFILLSAGIIGRVYEYKTGSHKYSVELQENTNEPVTDEKNAEPDTNNELVEQKNPIQSETTQAGPKTPSQTTTSPSPTNPFQVGFAAWYAFNRRIEVGKKMPGIENKTYGNPDYYCVKFKNDGYSIVTSPALYDIACISNASHVSIVEKVNDDGSIWVSEMNSRGQKAMTDTTEWGGWHQVDYKLIPAENLQAYFFIQ